ncbi:MAG TPA: MBL fold metallo-hydrolase [Gemmatimonadales bacterium]|nr:MBL fold metallo-hydrolase [Gemmatimonadales bacterium]
MLIAALVLSLAGAPEAPRPPLPVRRLAPGVYAVLGDTGRGSEGRANAGFVVTGDGVVAIDAQASPVDAERMLASIRSVTRQPVRWVILTHHHPDHHFGTIVFKRGGAQVIAHPETRTLSAEGGEDAALADWSRVVGIQNLLGFEYANTPGRPVTGTDTLRLGGSTLVVSHPGGAHTPGDLVVWLPSQRVLFAGDLLIEDGVSMVVDGNSGVMLRALDRLDGYGARVVVPGHGRIPTAPDDLVDSTRRYLTALRADMRQAVEAGTPMKAALAPLPPPDPERPVSPNSRRRRNAARVYVEMEREAFGLDGDTTP